MKTSTMVEARYCNSAEKELALVISTEDIVSNSFLKYITYSYCINFIGLCSNLN